MLLRQLVPFPKLKIVKVWAASRTKLRIFWNSLVNAADFSIGNMEMTPNTGTVGSSALIAQNDPVSLLVTFTANDTGNPEGGLFNIDAGPDYIEIPETLTYVPQPE